jgi:hypothetical protein
VGNPTDDYSNADLPNDSEIVITCPALGEGGGGENSTPVTVYRVTVLEEALAPSLAATPTEPDASARLSKPSIEVAETTPSSSPQQFQKGDRVCHPEYGAGTVEYISDWMASCIFDAATDSLGHVHHNTRRSPNISELSHLQE